MADELKMAAQVKMAEMAAESSPQEGTPNLVARQERVREMKDVFSLSGCHVTINMQF